MRSLRKTSLKKLAESSLGILNGPRLHGVLLSDQFDDRSINLDRPLPAETHRSHTR